MTSQAQPKPNKPAITLYLDTVSPFAYEAYYILRHDAAFKGCQVTFVPIFLGGLMHKCGNTAPMNIKNKDKWINAERLRWAGAFGIPITQELPPDFPPLTLNIMRAVCAVWASDDAQQTRLVRVLDALYAKYWVDGEPTHRPDVLRAVLDDVFGPAEADKILADASTVGKKLLIENTDAAFAAGAFGLPWLVCTNAKTGSTEGFFGVDHLGQVAQFLDIDLDRGGGRAGGWRSVL
ncbi:thioredoxin-like protein [Lasiosphaeria miniovina]|uniref:Glutathione S-transferase kappa n=1 Tax=Lasiosphaeria miniovina TaxID=1954250 RepID=A0AA40DMG0_9PEZI|nr:thioredoxin-like protein [Lasiosphaeria miniovina]KAK0706641.1 thioredoxin-like protein [Lasiosphaeria miniovina]